MTARYLYDLSTEKVVFILHIAYANFMAQNEAVHEPCLEASSIRVR